MATTSSQPAPRRQRLRQQTRAEALEHAVAIMTEDGVGGLTVTEVARRVGVRGPSMYKHFPSLHALYDALFARGLARSGAAVEAAEANARPGLDRLRRGCLALVAWAVAEPALAQLLWWRPVPGFEPSAATFAASRDEMAAVRADLGTAVRQGELDAAADSDDAVRLLTVVISGVVSQQMANEPGVREGSFSRIADEAFDMFVDHYRPDRRS